MPQTRVVFYQDDDRSVPFLDWFNALDEPVQDKCTVKLERLAELGHELRRPGADYLRDGIYELRVKHRRVNYRILYFFHGRTAVVISHGLKKEKKLPRRENRARAEFQANVRGRPRPTHVLRA